MYPLNFREFAYVTGNKALLETLSDWPVDREIPPLYSVPLERLLKDFYAVGGMPEAVSEWIFSQDMEEVESIQGEILRDYADYFSKHAPIKDVEKIRWIWDSVPVQLV